MNLPPHIAISCVANLFCRMMHFKAAGDIEHGHTHPFDHLTLLASGSLELEVDGVVTTFTAPHMVYIKAEKEHKLVALEADTVAYCIHALRDGNGVGDIIDPATIPKGVNPLSVTKPVVLA